MIRTKLTIFTCLIVISALLVSCTQSNIYGRLGGNDIPFTFDYQSKFFSDNTVFNQDIAIASLMVMSRQFDGQGRQVAESMGFEGFLVREIGRGRRDNDLKWTALAHRIVRHNDDERIIVLVAIPGAYGIEGWLSNLDIGADTPEYFELTNRQHNEWLNRYNHKGIDVTANRIIVDIKDYIHSIDSDAQPVLWITGFSRGGAIASIIGAYFESDPDVISFTYAFANPAITTSPTAHDYQTIFNILNEDDFTVFMWPEQWGFTRFGTDISISIYDYGQEAFRRLSGEDYTLRPNHFDNKSALIGDIVELIPNREALYIFDENVFFASDDFSTRDEAEAERRRLDMRLRSEHRQFAEFYIYELPNNGGYRVVHYQTPAFLFVSLSEMIYHESRGRTHTLPYFAEQFAGIPAAASQAFDMGHTHSPEAHYLIITELLGYAFGE